MKVYTYSIKDATVIELEVERFNSELNKAWKGRQMGEIYDRYHYVFYNCASSPEEARAACNAALDKVILSLKRRLLKLEKLRNG